MRASLASARGGHPPRHVDQEDGAAHAADHERDDAPTLQIQVEVLVPEQRAQRVLRDIGRVQQHIHTNQSIARTIMRRHACVVGVGEAGVALDLGCALAIALS